MKTPFPALYIDATGSAAPGVMFFPCTVKTLFPLSEDALIEIPSAIGRGRVFVKMVKFAQLASNQATATAKTAEALADLLMKLPAAAEKSASPEKAGAAAG